MSILDNYIKYNYDRTSLGDPKEKQPTAGKTTQDRKTTQDDTRHNSGSSRKVAGMLSNVRWDARTQHTGFTTSSALASVAQRARLRDVTLFIVVERRPIEDEVVLVVLTEEEVLEKPAQVRIVGAILETHFPAIVDVCEKLRGAALAQNLNWSGHLLLHDLVVFLFFRVTLHALPGERASDEVQEDVPEALQVVAARLLEA